MGLERIEKVKGNSEDPLDDKQTEEWRGVREMLRSGFKNMKY